MRIQWGKHFEKDQWLLYEDWLLVGVILDASQVAQLVKESTCNAGDPSWIPGLGRSPGEGIPTSVFLGFACGSAGKESAWNAGDLGSIPGLGRFPWRREKLPIPVFWPGEFHGLVHGVTKSQTQLSNFNFHFHFHTLMKLNFLFCFVFVFNFSYWIHTIF